MSSTTADPTARTDNPVLTDITDGIARIRLNRPYARNAVNLALCHALRRTFEDLDGDPRVRVVLLSGEGSAFCAGADLKERVDKDERWVRQRRLASFAAYEAIERCSKPVVASTHGAVVGSGGEIAMACDFILADRDTTFRFPEPHWGTVGATQRLQRVIGKRRAKELLFTNRLLGAPEAYTLGLVTRLVEPGELPAFTDEVCRSIAAAPALAIELTKQAIDLGEESDLDRGIRIEMAAIERCLADGGWREGVTRFTNTSHSAPEGERP
ncbi:enoyl-CoA hydratase/isomerase family protein [Rhodococcus sp. NPDC057529]|uniref:enoyl-CoA hydratase/isomerase family protein n=1 Tax=Rhodococcus sp. NPDC057529 TaxID=3346158 RepID=UPI00366EBDBD